MPTRWPGVTRGDLTAGVPGAEPAQKGRSQRRRVAFNGGSAQGPGGEGQLPGVGGVQASAEGPFCLSSRGWVASPLDLCTETALSQRDLGPRPPSAHRPAGPAAHSPSRTWNWSAASQKPGGQAGVSVAGARPAEAGQPPGAWGHSPYLGKYKMWSSVRLAPWTLCSNVLTAESSTGSERTVGHRAPGAPAGRVGRALWGQGLRARHPPSRV